MIMNNVLILVMWILALNTARLFVREVRNRRIEKSEYKEPSMLPDDFIIRDFTEDMFRPLLIVMFAALVLTIIIIANWLRAWYSYGILIAFILTFIVSWFIATDRIVWWAKVEGNWMRISFVNIPFTFERTLKIVDIEDIIVERRSNGNLHLFESRENREPLYLFWIEVANPAHELMVLWLKDAIAAADEKSSQQKTAVQEGELPIHDVVEEKAILQEDVLQTLRPGEAVKKPGGYLSKWKLFRLSIRGWTIFGTIIFIVAFIDIIVLGDRHNNVGLWVALFVVLILPVLFVTSLLSFRGIRLIKRQETLLWFSFNEEMKTYGIQKFGLRSGRHYQGKNWFIAVRFGRIMAFRRDFIISISDEKKLIWQTRFRPMFKFKIIGVNGRNMTAVGDDFFVDSFKQWFSGKEANEIIQWQANIDGKDYVFEYKIVNTEHTLVVKYTLGKE